jgi:hypothetical protein
LAAIAVYFGGYEDHERDEEREEYRADDGIRSEVPFFW